MTRMRNRRRRRCGGFECLAVAALLTIAAPLTGQETQPVDPVETRPATAPAVDTAPAEPPPTATRPAADSGPAIRDGDVIVFLGDELTESAGGRVSHAFPMLVETFLAVRYPDRQLRFINAGWTGDTAARAGLRLERDVLAHRPTVVVVCLGLNDPEYLPFAEDRLESYRSNLRGIAQRCADAGARVWLISPPAVEEGRAREARVMREGRRWAVNLEEISYNQTLRQYARVAGEVAEETGCGFVDWFATSSSTREQLQREFGTGGFTQDGIIPLPRGHAFLAAILLQAWKVEPIEVTIDLEWRRGLAEIRSTEPDQPEVSVEILEDGRRRVTLKRMPLPWPMPGGRLSQLAPEWSAAAMCRLMLKVTDPPEAGIVLSGLQEDAPDAPSPTLTSRELRAGVNLATLSPLNTAREPAEIFNLVNTKNSYRYTIWRRLEPRPPREAELAEAHRKLIDTWETFERGYEQLIHNRPKVFDTTLILRDNVRPDRLPTRLPAPDAQDENPRTNPAP